MKKILSVIFIVAFIVPINGARAQNPSDLFSYVAYLVRPCDSNLVKTGTGFFFAHHKYRFLVTAKHVSNFMDDKSLIVLRDTNGGPVIITMNDLGYGKTMKDWEKLEDADVAAIIITPPSKYDYLFTKNSFTEENLQQFDKRPDLTITCKAIGFPLGLGFDGKHFSPIIQDVKAVSDYFDYPMPQSHNTATIFAMVPPLAQGFSGAPIIYTGVERLGGFLSIQNSGVLACLGLCSSVRSDESGGKFSFIIPSQYIVTVLNQTIKKLEK